MFNRKKPAVRSVDSIMASFQQTIQDLNDLSVEKLNSAADIQNKINDLHKERELAVIEAEKAQKVSDNLNKILSV